eukprot:353417-Chlamydomonas_euryale.AAC.4
MGQVVCAWVYVHGPGCLCMGLRPLATALRGAAWVRPWAVHWPPPFEELHGYVVMLAVPASQVLWLGGGQARAVGP